jgi:hypothetical protein
LLLFVGGLDDGRRHCVVHLARNNQERATLGILCVDLGLGPRVEVGRGCLEQWFAGGGHRIGFVELLCLFLADGVGEGVPELVVGEGDGALAVGWIA